MAAKPRQLNLDELLRLKWLLGGATALVSLWTVFFLDIEALGLVAIASAMVAATLAWPQLPARVPELVWKLAVPAIIVTFAADLYLSPDTLPALIRLAMLLVLYRAASHRRKREDLQLLVLGLFLIVVAGVLTVAIEFAFLLLLFTACALGFLFVINLVDAAGTGAVRTSEAETAWTRLGWRKFFARLRAVADWRLLAFGSALFTAVVVMSGLLFLIIPRFELASGFFLDRYITRKSRSGFTDTIRFGDVTELAKDDAVAMRVDLTDASGIREEPYWRLVVLDEYTPEGFKVSARLKGQLLRSQQVRQTLRGRALAGYRNNSVGGTWTFYVEPGVSRFLPLPGSFANLRMRDQVPLQTTFAQNRGSGAPEGLIEGMRLVALRTEAMSMTAFQIEGVGFSDSIPDATFARLLRGWVKGGEGVRDDRNYDARIMLQGPAGAGNEATLQRIVAEITGGVPLPADEFGRRATAWLQGRHAYALSVKIPPGKDRDDLVRWLDSNEPGFCEYFAAGLTVLARAAGHPARVVAGFHGGTLNAYENYFMVKNSDAHAWMEIYDGKAWWRLDATPGNGGVVVQGGGAGQQIQDSSWSARLDTLRVLWYRRIVNFDSRQQVQMLDQVKSITQSSGASLRAALDEFAKRLKAWLARPWDVARIFRLVVLAGGAAAAVWLVLRVGGAGWRRWRHRGQPAAYDPVRQTAGRWLGRLRRPAPGVRYEVRGVRAEDGKPETENGEPNIDDGVVLDLQRLRYGRRETWPEPRGVFKRAREARRAARR